METKRGDGVGHRTLKRVPLDFSLPFKKVWKGYINPNSGPSTCNLCDGSGLNAVTNQISEDFYDNNGFGMRWRYDYGFDPEGKPAARPPWRTLGESRAWCNNITQDEVQALIDRGRLMNFTHEWTHEKGWKPKQWPTPGFWCPVCKIAVPQLSAEHLTAHCTLCDVEMLLLAGDDKRLQHVPTPVEVNEWNQRGMGHDGINRWILIETRAKRLGVYGKCPDCKEKGTTRLPRKLKKKHNGWKEFEPPTGPGYQLWETCSEGSPISPVFASAEELADWCADNATILGNEKTSRENWLEMFGEKVGVDVGSLFIGFDGYLGAAVNAPR